MSKIINKPVTIMYHTYVADLSGCGYIRCIYPSMLMSQYVHKDMVRFLPSYGIHFINDKSFYKNQLFTMFQRSATPDQLILIKHFKKHFRYETQTPLIYEIDDLLTDIPDWNYASTYYRQHSHVALEIIKMMDGMIVSTNKLKEIFSQYQPKIQVCLNHLVKGHWGEPKYKVWYHKKPKILWAGSGNHFSQEGKGGDFGDKLLNFIQKTSNKYEWNILGGCPLELKNDKNVIKHGWVNLFEYPNYIKSLHVDLAIAPLEQNLFNECKSNIKSLEYTAAGIPAIYTNIEPYKNLSVVCDTEDLMIYQIETHLNNPDLLKKIWEKDYKILKNQLFWEDNNNLSKYFNKIIGNFNFKLTK